MTPIGKTNLSKAYNLSYTVPDVIPSGAKEVLVHASLHCGYSMLGPYISTRFYTQIGNNRYEQYLILFSWEEKALNTNSDNMWFPMPTDRLIHLVVMDEYGDDGAGATMFAIGYR